MVDNQAEVTLGDCFLDEEVARELGKLGTRIHFEPLWEHDLRRILRDLPAVLPTSYNR